MTHRHNDVQRRLQLSPPAKVLQNHIQNKNPIKFYAHSDANVRHRMQLELK